VEAAQWIEYGLIHGIKMQKCMGFFLFECWSFNSDFRTRYLRHNLSSLITEIYKASVYFLAKKWE
jgi:hypothetical protein